MIFQRSESKHKKYHFKYAKTDYPYNIQYKWLHRHSPNSSKQERNTYFIEMILNRHPNQLQVQQLSPEACEVIDQAWTSGEERVYIRSKELHGHYLNLVDQTLVSTVNMAKRKLYTLQNLPEGAIIYHHLTQTSMRINTASPRRRTNPTAVKVVVEDYSPQHLLRHQDQALTSKLQDLSLSAVQQLEQIAQYHWMEITKSNKYKALKQSLSDTLERQFQLYSRKLCNPVVEISWQQERFIFDLKRYSLQNAHTLEIQLVHRINLTEVDDIQSILRSEANNVKIMEPTPDYNWQFEVVSFINRGTEWQSYDQKNQKRLERKFKQFQHSGVSKSFPVKRGQTIFYIDFKKMVELDTVFKTVSKIRRMNAT